MQVTNSHVAATWLGLAAIASLACDDALQTVTPGMGAIEITVSTAAAAEDVDPDGYLVSIDGGLSKAIDVNGTLTIGDLTKGTHLVQLHGLESNCTISGATLRAVSVIGSNPGAPVSFTVSCISKSGTDSPWDY